MHAKFRDSPVVARQAQGSIAVRGATRHYPRGNCRSLRPGHHIVFPPQRKQHRKRGENHANVPFSILIILFVSIVGYTLITVSNHGWGLVPDIFRRHGGNGLARASLTSTFLGFLILSALWIAWRYKFSATGLLLSPLALTGGILFLSFYLLVISFTEGGTIKSILLGKQAES